MNEAKTKFLKLTVQTDQDMENPCENDGWKLYSFNARHASYKNPEALGLSGTLGEDGLPSVSNKNRGLRNKIQHGLAYFLSYYEHSRCIWFLNGESPPFVEFQWDGVRLAGLLVWEGEYKEIPKAPEERRRDAEAFLKTYTSYCNGDGVWFNLEDETGDFVDGCGGFYSLEEAMEAIREAIPPQYQGCPIVLEGDYADSVKSYHSIEGHEYLDEVPDEKEDD